MHGISAPLLVMARACEIGQDTPHQLRADSEKMCSVLPVDIPDIDQTQIDFVDKSGSLKRVIGSLGSHVTPRQAVQLFVHQGR